MQIKKFKTSELNPATYNPRKELQPGDPEFEKLKNSIKEFGYVEPIILNTKNMVVVGGHQRLSVLKHMGITEVDCVVVDIDEQKEKALNIALNKISGEWDELKLADLMKDLKLSGFDTSLTGFDLKELDSLFSGAEYDIQEDDMDASKEHESISQPYTQSGDLWHIGPHRLLCGDATATADITRLMGGEQADLIVTDPPYNIDYGTADDDRREHLGKEVLGRQILNDNMSDESFGQFLLGFYKNAYSVIKGGGVIYVFHSTKESVNFIQAMKIAGFKVSQTLIWAKDHFTLGRSDYQWQFEPILYGWKEEPGKPHYFIHDRTQSTVIENGTDLRSKKKEELLKLLEHIIDTVPSDIIRENKPMRNAEHPTMKPITLIARLVQNSSREGEIVFDPFGGSGSTLMACAQMNRKAYLCELDEKYCDVIIRRAQKMFPDLEITLERDGTKVPVKNTKLVIE